MKSTTTQLLAQVALATSILIAPLAVATGDTPEAVAKQEQKQIEILKSDAKPADKALACKRLAIYGSGKAVPVVTPLLSDPRLCSWARIALEAIPGPEADRALRDAVATVKGRQLVGVINSIGVRRDAEALPILTERLKDSDPAVEAAAAAALGMIGSEAAAAALTPTLTTAPPECRSAMAEGCILCAERLLAAGKKAPAIALYDAVKAANISPQRTIEGTRGAIVARGDAGIPMLLKLLNSDDDNLFGVGLRVSREITSAAVTAGLVEAFGKTTPRRQAALLRALVDRGNPEAIQTAIKATQSSDRDLQLLALRLLDRLASPAAVPALLTLAKDKDAKLSLVAKSALTRLQGPAVEAAVADLLKAGEPEHRLLGIDLLSHRGSEGAAGRLLEVACDPDKKVRVSALKALGGICGIPELPALLAHLKKTESSSEIRATEGAINTVCSRSVEATSARIKILKAVYGNLPAGKQKDVTKKVTQMVQSGKIEIEASNTSFGDPAPGVVKKLRIDFAVDNLTSTKTVKEKQTIKLAVPVVSPICTEKVLAALQDATGEARLALLRILPTLGSKEALAAAQAAASDADPKVKETAIRAVCSWPSADALPDLMQRARSSGNPTLKILALRGAIRLVDQCPATPEKRLEDLKGIVPLLERPDEKRLLLAALGNVPALDSLAMIMPHLSDSALKEEAAAAAVSVGERMSPARPAPVLEAARKVVDVSGNKQTKARARALLAK